MRRLGVWSCYAAAFTLTWNGWYVGPVRPGDVLVLVTLLFFAVSATRELVRGLPWWVIQITAALLLLMFLLVVRPPDTGYLIDRVRLDAGGVPLPSPPASVLSNLATGGKFIVGVAAIPLAFATAAAVHARVPERLAFAFVTGSALSGLAAFVDHLHVASVGQILTGLANVGNRQVGFTSNPNFLAAALVLAMPFAAWMTTHEGPGSLRTRQVGWVSLAALVLGTYSSGSRGGAVMTVVTLFVSYALLPRSRRYVAAGALVAVAAFAVAFGALPSLGARLLTTTRLGSGLGAGSSEVRGIVGHQGVEDFLHFPFYGVGLQFGTDASQVYLQELSAGGLLLFVTVSVYLLGAAIDALRLVRFDSLAAAVLGSIVATIGLDFVEADLTDRFYYVPEAILVAMLVAVPTMRHRADVDPQRPAARPRIGRR